MAAVSHAGTVRQLITFVEQTYPEVAREMHRVLAHARTVVELGDMVPAHLTIDLLEQVSSYGGPSDVGIRFVEYLNVRGFGPVALLWKHCSNFWEVYRVTMDYLRLENGAIAPECIEEDEDSVAWINRITERSELGSAQFGEALTALIVRMFREYLNPAWKPVRVDLQSEQLKGRDRIRKYFGCPVIFEADRYAVIIRKTDMCASLPQRDPETLRLLTHHLNGLKSEWPESIAERAGRTIESRLSEGQCSLADIALSMGTTARTLQRRLRNDGLEFRDLIARVRVRRAEQYFAQTSHPNLAKLSFLLGFTEQSSASRFLKQRMGRKLRSGRGARQLTKNSTARRHDLA